MAEYIERDEALNAIERSYWTEGAYERVERLPAADVVPVVHGRWIFKRGCYEADECSCTLCGQLLTTHAKERANYCPNCGARMDGE